MPQLPKFVSLSPTITHVDRVSLDLVTAGFVSRANVFFDFETDAPNVADTPPADPEEMIRNSPYPNVELSILDPDECEVASLFIVEHKEEHISLTMHLRSPQPGERYIARADMIHNRQVVESLTTPFILQPETKGGDV